MKAYVYQQAGVSRMMSDLRMPQAQRDTLVIKVRACTLCGTDLRAWQHGNKMITPPRVLGHEVCGEIVEVGPDRKGFQVGQRISMAPAIGCGSCYPCRRGFVNLCDNLKTIGFNFDGGFAEYMEVPAIAFDRGNVYHTPEGVTDEEAALAEPIACVVNGQEFLHIEPGDSIAIFGSGFIGCMLLLILFGVVAWRAFRIARLSRDLYGTFIAAGVGGVVIFQVFLNVGMTIGILPVTGVPLPFVSFGSASLIVFLMAIGLLQSVHVHSVAAEFK